MLQRFLPDIITYDGTQLSSHWAFRTQGILGDSIVIIPGTMPGDASRNGLIWKMSGKMLPYSVIICCTSL